MDDGARTLDGVAGDERVAHIGDFDGDPPPVAGQQPFQILLDPVARQIVDDQNLAPFGCEPIDEV